VEKGYVPVFPWSAWQKGICMLRLRKPRPISERNAEGEIERVYHEITQTLRVSGINLNFRTWAGYNAVFPALWDAVRPNVETRAFEDAADHIRAEAVHIAEHLGHVNASQSVRSGESQAYQIQAVLMLYHYINPKLLVLTAAVRLALAGEHLGRKDSVSLNLELIERGVPATMYPMEMVEEKPADTHVRALFTDIKRTLALPSINSDYRTLALWPEYLGAAWEQLKPIITHARYRQATTELRETARSLAKMLPQPIPFSRERIEELGEDADALTHTTEQFEQLLPALILNIALCAREWRTPEVLTRSPFPAHSRSLPLNQEVHDELARVSSAAAHL
jgi:hypothetical protein